MDITCPKCNFSKTVDPAKVPDHPVRVNCPKCSEGFTFDKAARLSAPREQVTCPACGLVQDKGEGCRGCGVIYAKWQKRMTGAPPGESARPIADPPPGQRIICHACGTVQPPGGRCVSCGATMVTTASPVVESPEYSYAGFWIRVVAYLLDSCLLGGVQFVLSLLIGMTVGMLGLAADNDPSINVVIWLFGAALSIGYAVFFTGYCGQTPGKMALRIKVTRTDGSPVSYGRAALREVPGKFISGILLGIGYLMVAFDSRKQGLHDRIADTYVIKL